MMQYRCKKHGFLEAHERAMWSKNAFVGRWCIHCMNDAMDTLCGKLELIEVIEEPIGET